MTKNDTSNGALDPRRWQQLRAEHDNLRADGTLDLFPQIDEPVGQDDQRDVEQHVDDDGRARRR